MVDITQDKIRIRTMVPGDAAALLKWMTDARVLEFYEGRDKRYTEEKTGTIEAGGYIWHTTGSGKTLTSFKTGLRPLWV